MTSVCVLDVKDPAIHKSKKPLTSQERRELKKLKKLKKKSEKKPLRENIRHDTGMLKSSLPLDLVLWKPLLLIPRQWRES